MRQALNNHTHLSPSNDTPIKILAINNIIKNIPSSDKIIIFSYFTSFLLDLHNILPNSLIFHGKLNSNTRQETLSCFKTDPSKKILLINLRAGGCGLNLTEANHLILVEPYWNKSEEDQAINRIHRYGQTKSCFIYKLQINNSIESWMKAIQLSKKTTSDIIVDNLNINTQDLILQKENQDLLFKKIISFN
jgi:SNF2 family DNA or RNA helicase